MPNNRIKLLHVYYRRLRSQSLEKTINDIRRLRRAAWHLKRITLADSAGRSNVYVPSYSIAEEVRFCADILACPEAAVTDVFAELESDTEFLETLHTQYSTIRPEARAGFHLGRFRIWYAIVRLVRPSSVIETGVHDGHSSALILRALSRNGSGTLASIDLPSTDLPVEATGPGWLIPDGLKSRWQLYLGDARSLLPSVAATHAPIDLFIHDSDHSYAHRQFEYETIRPYLSPSGLLLTDHDHEPDLLDDLASAWSASHFRVRSTAEPFKGYIGGLRFS